MNFLTGIFTKKDEPIKTYTDFWTWFQQNEKSFFKIIKQHNNIEKGFFDKILPKLNELRDGIYLLTGMSDENTAELILTPEGVIKNIGFVEELIMAAPLIPGWKFTALKPSLNIENVSISMAGHTFNSETLSFYSKDDDSFPDEVNIVIVYKNYKEKDKNMQTDGVFIFLDNFLGELKAVSAIDTISVIGKEEAEQDLIPISKLKDFLVWREKEFLEHYEGERHDTENDTYSGIETRLKNGRTILAVINTTLLEWDRKASHPWLMTVKIKYKGDKDNGMPDNITYELMSDFENEIMNELKDYDGYLNIGRETGDNLRELYFACKEFRKASKVMHNLVNRYHNKLDVSYDIYLEKYWRSMDRYRNI